MQMTYKLTEGFQQNRNKTDMLATIVALNGECMLLTTVCFMC